MIELNVRFTSSDRFVIKFDDRETDALEFIAPVNDGDRAEMRTRNKQFTARRDRIIHRCSHTSVCWTISDYLF